ncbi:MAG: sodium-dependent transporter [Candidatus Omnitrophica bacterium]|nr:sodium-dependent transporter [Candidatus Omnitrophota bacterium]
MAETQRESWGSRIGLILAVAGSAVGLGNFLRFPVQAVKNGGGAFIIPYLVSFLLLGIPLMWIEWTLGRFGGGFGHGTAPGMFHNIANKNRFIKYFGVIGIFGPIAIFTYYTYIESWLLGYSLFSLTGKLAACQDQSSMISFLKGYQGLEKNQFFFSLVPAYIFFLLTFAINIITVAGGIQKGIEKVCKYGLPVLFILGLVLMIRVLTLKPMFAEHPDWTPAAGLGFLWNPDFSSLLDAKVWLAAAGQIFFTLSVGIGVILTYASYLKKNDDVILSGLTAAATNEWVEIVLGGSIAITSAFLFFGPAGVKDVAASGAFNLGFVAMPLALNNIHYGSIFGFFWFFLLFIAGVTSSISLAQPAIAFLEDEFNIDRKKAVKIFASVTFVLCNMTVFLLGKGFLDEFDFWGGTFALVLFGTIEAILFSWVFGIDRAWDEMHAGSDIKLPGFYRFIIKYITPTFLVVILVSWIIKEAKDIILMKNMPENLVPYIIFARLILFALFVSIGYLVHLAWEKKDRLLMEKKL